MWTNRPIWPQGVARPKKADAIPSNLDWNLWLGPAAERPYNGQYCPFSWRGWWDFGTGALGDMACHTLNMPFMALTLRDPLAVTATTSGHNKETYPGWSIIDFEFPARTIIRGGGYLVSVASAAGLLSQIGDAAYTATKHAAVAFAESLAITHGDDGLLTKDFMIKMHILLKDCSWSAQSFFRNWLPHVHWQQQKPLKKNLVNMLS